MLYLFFAGNEVNDVTLQNSTLEIGDEELMKLKTKNSNEDSELSYWAVKIIFGVTFLIKL